MDPTQNVMISMDGLLAQYLTVAVCQVMILGLPIQVSFSIFRVLTKEVNSRGGVMLNSLE